MPVSGLVVTLAPPGPEAERAAAWLQGDARFAVGQPEPASPGRLPVTLDTADRDEDKDIWEQMQDHPGIAFVDVACVFFEEDAPGSDPGSSPASPPASEPANSAGSVPGNIDTAPSPALENSHARSRPW